MKYYSTQLKLLCKTIINLNSKLSITLLTLCLALSTYAQTRVVCVGNSITEGYGLTDATQPYPYQLGLLLGSGFKVYNYGASGTCMVRNDPASYWNTNHFVNAKNTDPQIVIIKLGTNDADPPRWNVHKGEYYNDYVAMIAEFRKNGRNPKIFVGFPVPTFGSVKAPQGSIILNEVIPLIKQVAATQGVNIIDYNSPMTPYGNLFPDGIHPNADGAKKLARIAFDAITGISGKSGTFSLQNRNSNLYMDIDGGSNVDGAHVIQWNSTNGPNQKFTFTEVSSGVYTITSVSSGKYLDISGGSVDNGAISLQWGFTGGYNQRYTLLATDNGYYKLKAVHSGRILDVSGASNAAGAGVLQWDDNNQTNGQWKLIPVSAARMATAGDASVVMESNADIVLYPNPSKGTVTLKNVPPDTMIMIYDSSGKTQLQSTSPKSTGDVTLDVSSLVNGTYYIKIGNKEKKEFKLLKQ